MLVFGKVVNKIQCGVMPVIIDRLRADVYTAVGIPCLHYATYQMPSSKRFER